jgi:hypothetical protein
MSPPPSPNAKLERSYTLHKDREKLEQVKSGLQSEAAQGNIDVVLERLLKLDAKVHPRDVPAVYKRALLRFHPDRHVGKPIAKRASYEERYWCSFWNISLEFELVCERAPCSSLSLSRDTRESLRKREREKSDDSATVAFVVACGSPHPSRLNISFSLLRKRLLFR